MAPARHVALWLAAAIVSIVVGLMPSAAEAHGGHPHPASVHATSPHVDTGFAETTGSVVMKAATVEAALSCFCPACAHGGSGCCATGLAPVADWTPPAPRPRGQATSRDGPIPTGIVPEALPEPPRIFA